MVLRLGAAAAMQGSYFWSLGEGTGI
jgi:hypothetical protein